MLGTKAGNLMTRLLIVEDNEPMRDLISSIVGDMFEDITECCDGLEALCAYAECQPDWVLMDIRMPGLDGIAATTRIKGAFPDARVVMVTDYDNSRLREAARNAGACAYVLKENLLDLRNIIALQNHVMH